MIPLKMRSFSFYYYYFGQHSITKYFDKGVIIVNYEEEPDTIAPPALVIYPMNSDPALPLSGWKHQNLSQCSNCSILSGEDLIQALEKASYSTEDVIQQTSTDGETYWKDDDWYDIKRFYINFEDGIIQSVEIQNDTVMSNNKFSTASFVLNKNISYLIYFMDRKLQFITGSPDVIPRSLWISKLGITNLYLKVIRHEKLNRPIKPCDPSPEYDLGTCLERSLITRAGCQPPWRRVTVEEYPICDDWTMMDSYDTEFWNFYNSDRKTLFKNSDCLMPCSFMEYKVNSLSIK